ncbi:NINE protein [Olsenella sp. oral taxon 807]|uniref:NINE protein n=1 Tax=Olsenella sp. oral taxon 807 TaxID=712411 RepID=UPI00067D882B|nr:NINE protein [Olsenella sp. oral taxon 807]
MAEQVPEEETGTDSAIGEGVDTQDITVNDVPESTEGDEGAKAQPSTDPEELVDTRPSELDEPTPNEPTPTNSEVTGESETKQEDEKPLFSEAIDHGEHPEGTDSSPSPQPQTETLETQLHPQEPSQAPYSTGQKSHLASDVTQWNPQTQAQASYPQTQAQAQASYSQQAQPQLPYPQQAQQQASYSQQAQPQLPYPQQQASYSQQAQQQAPYTQPYPQQQASYTQVQVFTNSQPTGGGPTKSKVAAGLLAIFLGTLGIHKFYLGRTGEGILILVLDILLGWTFIVPGIIEFVCFIEALIYFTKSDEEFQRDCVRG